MNIFLQIIIRFNPMYPQLYEQIYEEEKTCRNLNGFDQLIELPKYEDLHMFEDLHIDSSNLVGFSKIDIQPISINNITEKKNILNRILNLYPNNVFAAGGFVLNCYTGSDMSLDQDIDLFISCNSVEEFKEICLKIYESFEDDDVCFKLSENCLYIIHSRFIEIKIVLRQYTNPSQIIHEFDIDCCCILYTAEHKYYATKRGIYSIKNKINVFNFDRLSPNYEYQFIKYHRCGYDIYIPQYYRLLDVIKSNWYDRELFNIRKGSYVFIEYLKFGYKNFEINNTRVIDEFFSEIFESLSFLRDGLYEADIKTINSNNQTLGIIPNDINNWYPIDLQVIVPPKFSPLIMINLYNEKFLRIQTPLFGLNINRYFSFTFSKHVFKNEVIDLFFEKFKYDFCLGHTAAISYITKICIDNNFDFYILEEANQNIIQNIISMITHFYRENVIIEQKDEYLFVQPVLLRLKNPKFKFYFGERSYKDILNSTHIDYKRFIYTKDREIITDELGIYAWKNKVQINNSISLDDKMELEKHGFAVIMN